MGIRIIGRVDSNIGIDTPISISEVKASNDNRIIVEFKKYDVKIK
jgi:hypothetical protein